MFTNKTKNYDLPQYLGTDRAEWLDNNAAFETIDSNLKEAAVNAESAGNAATNAGAVAAQAKTAADNAQATATKAQNTADTNATNIAGLSTRVSQTETGLQNVQTEANKLTSQMGGLSIVTLTQSEYDALETKSETTVYFVEAGE